MFIAAESIDSVVEALVKAAENSSLQGVFFQRTED